MGLIILSEFLFGIVIYFLLALLFIGWVFLVCRFLFLIWLCFILLVILDDLIFLILLHLVFYGF